MSSDVLVVDVIVAVHNNARPVERAVSSALDNQIPVRVSVVAHNVDAALIAERLAGLITDPRVRVLGLADGVRSPANAFNHGIAAATAEFVCVLGSDDALEPGALDAWVDLAERHRADAVIAPIVRDDGNGVPTPRVRSRRRIRLLDSDRDRLFERTAALGIQRRATTATLRYTDGLPRGVDQEYGLRLWTTARVVFDPEGPVYREHGDQADRVTHAFGPLRDDFAFLPGFLELLATLENGSVQRAVAAKIIRVHVIPAVRNRVRAGSLTVEDLTAAAEILVQLAKVAPGAIGLLPRELGAELAAIDAGSLHRAVAAQQRTSSRLGSLIPVRARLALHRHAPLRSGLAGRQVMRRTAAGYAERAQGAWETQRGSR